MIKTGEPIMDQTILAIVFTIFSGIVILFQFCLAIGLPWGSASMGGKYPGKYPPKMRIVAIVNMAVLSFLAGIVLIRAGLFFPQFFSFSKIGIWFVVVFSGIGTVSCKYLSLTYSQNFLGFSITKYRTLPYY